MTRPSRAIEHWDGDELALPGAITLLRLGGHSTAGPSCTGRLAPRAVEPYCRGHRDGRPRSHRRLVHVELPEPVATAGERGERIAAALEPVTFDRIHGAWWSRYLVERPEAVRRGVERDAVVLRRCAGRPSPAAATQLCPSDIMAASPNAVRRRSSAPAPVSSASIRRSAPSCASATRARASGASV